MGTTASLRRIVGHVHTNKPTANSTQFWESTRDRGSESLTLAPGAVPFSSLVERCGGFYFQSPPLFRARNSEHTNVLKQVGLFLHLFNHRKNNRYQGDQPCVWVTQVSPTGSGGSAYSSGGLVGSLWPFAVLHNSRVPEKLEIHIRKLLKTTILTMEINLKKKVGSERNRGKLKQKWIGRGGSGTVPWHNKHIEVNQFSGEIDAPRPNIRNLGRVPKYTPVKINDNPLEQCERYGTSSEEMNFWGCH